MALALGRTLGELSRTMSHAELMDWAEYSGVEPFGSHYDDLRAGTVAAAVYNVNRDQEKHPGAFSPLEFTPWNAASEKLEPAAVVLDPEAASALLDAVLFGKAP